MLKHYFITQFVIPIWSAENAKKAENHRKSKAENRYTKKRQKYFYHVGTGAELPRVVSGAKNSSTPTPGAQINAPTRNLQVSLQTAI